MRSSLAARWPTALGLVGVAGAVPAIVLTGAEAEFAPGVAAMAGMYLGAYALGRPATVWLAFPAVAALMAVMAVIGLNVAVGMTVVLVWAWLWTLVAGRREDGRLFTVQTGGMVLFGAITLAAVAVDPRIGGVLAGVGFFAHGLWDVAHFRANKVVNRPWSEFCAVVDLPVGLTLLVVALTR